MKTIKVKVKDVTVAKKMEDGSFAMDSVKLIQSNKPKIEDVKEEMNTLQLENVIDMSIIDVQVKDYEIQLTNSLLLGLIAEVEEIEQKDTRF